MHAASWYSSLSSSKARSIWRSCEKTLTTFSPFMTSSTRPSTAATARCVRRKFLAERPASALPRSAMMTAPPTTTSVRGRLYQSMMQPTEQSMSIVRNSCGSDCAIIWRMASMSLV